MTSQQPILDVHGILDVTSGAAPEKVLRFREELIHLLRALEDMHGIKHAVPPKSTNNQDVQRREGHHNR